MSEVSTRPTRAMEYPPENISESETNKELKNQEFFSESSFFQIEAF
jgi:hypothetical protein